jgi:hypothetical protein
LNGAVPDPTIEPVADFGPPGVEADQGCAVECVHVEGVPEDGKELRYDFTDCIGGFGGLDRPASIEVPAQSEAEEDDQRRGEHDREKARFRKSGKAKCG